MSKIGKIPVPVPAGVTVSVDAANLVVVKGPKGELSQQLLPSVIIEQAENELQVKVKNPDDRSQRAVWGLSRSLLFNMVHGVSQGYERKLEINGVGYRAVAAGQLITLNLGYSHPVEFQLPQGITAKVEKNLITLSGIHKQQIGEIAAQIRKLRPPEPYKGKGIKYLEETIRRKAGKAVKSAEGK